MRRHHSSTVINACVILAISLLPGAAGAQVPGYPNPFGGRWTAHLESTADSVGTLAITLTLRDTTFNGRFVVDLDGTALLPLVGTSTECNWEDAEFLGRFYWDPERNPVREFVKVVRGGVVENENCRFELRVLVRPDGHLIGWWCEGPWNSCQREGPALLRQER